jgi:hypothetical protein
VSHFARVRAPVCNLLGPAGMNTLLTRPRRASWLSLPCSTSALAAALALASCTVNNGPKYPDLNSFCNGEAMAECSPQVVLDCAVANASTCIANRQAVCVAAAPAGTTYDPTLAENCISVISNAYSDAQLTLAESDAISAACTVVYNGPGAPDAACQVDTDCKVSTGLRCVLHAGSSTGTCQIPQPVQGGGSCAASDAQCVAGFHCGATAHCDIDGALNEACDAPDPCEPDLTCDATTMLCAAKGADGTACATGEDCTNGICNKGSGQAMGLCVSQVVLAPDEPFCVDSR